MVEEKKNTTYLAKLGRWMRESTAIFLWLYLFMKVAVFDFDVYVAENYFPQFRWILDFKLIILLGIICILWIILGRKSFPLLIVYIIGYPFVVIFWKLPKLIFRNWSTAIVLTPIAFDIVSAFRLYFMSYSLAIFAIACIASSNNLVGLILSMFLLLILLVMHLISSFKQAYKATVFSKISQGISELKKKIIETSFLKDVIESTVKNSGNDSDSDKNYKAKLSTVYMFHSGVEFLTDKIRDVLRSRKMDLYLILSWLWTFVVTALIYSFEYYALFKIDSASFSTPNRPGFLSFLGFSFGKLTPSSVSSISPNSVYATALCYAELASSLVIVVILVFTILTAARERYKEDIESLTRELNDIGVLIQSNAQGLFNLAMTDIEIILLTQNREMVNMFRRMRGMAELLAPQTKTEGTNAENKS